MQNDKTLAYVYLHKSSLGRQLVSGKRKTTQWQGKGGKGKSIFSRDFPAIVTFGGCFDRV